MNRKQWKLWLAGGAGVAVVATVAAISGPAVTWAQDATPTAPTTEQRGAGDAPFAHPGGEGGRHGSGMKGGGIYGGPGMAGFGRGASSESLAEALGITVEELNSAQRAAAEAAVAEALDAGILTEEQAATIRERLAESEGGLGRIPFGMGFHRGMPSVEDTDGAEVKIVFDQLLADALGITTDELSAARASARDAALADAIATGEITQEQVDLIEARSALREYLSPESELTFEEAVAQAVEDGVVTQSQADSLLGADAMMGGPRSGGPGMGGPDMGGPRGRGGENAPLAPGSEAQPTSPLENSGDTQG